MRRIPFTSNRVVTTTEELERLGFEIGMKVNAAAKRANAAILSGMNEVYTHNLTTICNAYDEQVNQLVQMGIAMGAFIASVEGDEELESRKADLIARLEEFAPSDD